MLSYTVKYTTALCPKCDEIILVRNTLPFVLCAICKQSISTGESIEALGVAIKNPARISDLLTTCIKLGQMYKPVVPLSVLNLIVREYPDNEEASYLIVKYSDYNPIPVKVYLDRCAEIEKKKRPFAEEFLEKTMFAPNMAFVDQFETYIENKLPKDKQATWLKKLREQKEEYIGKRSNSGLSLPFLYAYYVICSLINIGAAVAFIILDWGFLVSGILMALLFIVELGLLWVHNRWYGNRLTLAKVERLLMTIFMCSLPVTLGGVLLGSILTF